MLEAAFLTPLSKCGRFLAADHVSPRFCPRVYADRTAPRFSVPSLSYIYIYIYIHIYIYVQTSLSLYIYLYTHTYNMIIHNADHTSPRFRPRCSGPGPPSLA